MKPIESRWILTGQTLARMLADVHSSKILRFVHKKYKLRLNMVLLPVFELVKEG